jgi:hypothetical protein
MPGCVPSANSPSSADNRKENQNMARFPECEADIKALAQSIISGLTNNPDFPNPPFTPAQLQTLLDSFISLCDTQVADQAKAQQSTEAKQHGQEDMTSALKSAENAVDGNHAKLTALGWGSPAARQPGPRFRCRDSRTRWRLDIPRLEGTSGRWQIGLLSD